MKIKHEQFQIAHSYMKTRINVGPKQVKWLVEKTWKQLALKAVMKNYLV
jgi:hypothetical protein